MSDKPKSWGPAFPLPPQYETSEGGVYRQIDPGWGGMDLRDWFAGMAMQGMAASETWSQNFDSSQEAISKYLPEVAKVAYIAADAMLAEREKEVPNEKP